VGVWGRVDQRVDLGVSYEGAFTVDGTREVGRSSGRGGIDSTQTSTSSQKIDYPGTLRFGLVYHPRNRLRTTFAVDLERRFWESLDEPVVGAFGDSVDARDTWDFRIGLEHLFYNDLPVRFGFRYLENYADSESERSIYSAGIGYQVGGWGLDLTGLFIRQTSRQGFLFNAGALAPLVPGGTEKVEDTVVQAVFGVSRAF
jgi:long-subunit fatty acid transport protein